MFVLQTQCDDHTKEIAAGVGVNIIFLPALKSAPPAHKPQLSFNLYRFGFVLILSSQILLQCYLRCRQAG